MDYGTLASLIKAIILMISNMNQEEALWPEKIISDMDEEETKGCDNMVST